LKAATNFGTGVRLGTLPKSPGEKQVNVGKPKENRFRRRRKTGTVEKGDWPAKRKPDGGNMETPGSLSFDGETIFSAKIVFSLREFDGVVKISS
jgi:hypothetical protein